MQNSSKIIIATLALVLANLGIVIYIVFLPQHKSAASPEIVTPRIAIEALEAKTVYFTPQARACLLSQKPLLLTPEDKDEKSERSTSFARAAQDAALWRQLDHLYQFDGILLSGDPVTFQPLLSHLLETHDWTLTYLDHTSLIFKRTPAKAWTPADLESISKKFATLKTPDRVSFLIQAAGKLSAVTQYTLAKHYLDEAMQLDPKSPDTLTQLALYYAHFSQWNKVVETSDHALSIDRNNVPALTVKAQGLQAMRRYDEALKTSDHLVEVAANDPNVLFLHARIAHAAHAYSREIAALKTIISIIEPQQFSVSGYRIYLAQAHASNGDALPALEQFQKALAAGDLSPEQKAYVEESIQRIKSRM